MGLAAGHAGSAAGHRAREEEEEEWQSWGLLGPRRAGCAPAGVTGLAGVSECGNGCGCPCGCEERRGGYVSVMTEPCHT